MVVTNSKQIQFMGDKNSLGIVLVAKSAFGLLAEMALVKELGNSLITDSGKPCTVQAPSSQNFITQK